MSNSRRPMLTSPKVRAVKPRAARMDAGDDVRAWWATALLGLKRSLMGTLARVCIIPEWQGAKSFNPDKVKI